MCKGDNSRLKIREKRTFGCSEWESKWKEKKSEKEKEQEQKVSGDK